MKNSDGTITIQSYNPYAPICPQTRVVSRETLHLIKELRSKGFTVIIEPEDGTKLNYVTEKGWHDLFADPIFLFIASIPLSLITGLITNFLYDYIKNGFTSKNVNIVIQVDKSGEKLSYSHTGSPISDARFQSLVSILEKRRNNSALIAAQIPNLYNQKPFPIFLEHTDKIVGWARDIAPDDIGLSVVDMKIVDKETRAKVINKKLQGMSIAGVVTKSKCAICGKEYTDCNHLASRLYKGKQCSVEIQGMCIADISIVKKPINPRAKLELSDYDIDQYKEKPH